MEKAQDLPKFSLTPGWICLAGCSLSILLLGPVLGFVFAAPLGIAALVLSIIAMAKNNVTGGILLMILTFILPPLAFLASLVLTFALPSIKKSSSGGSSSGTTTPPAIEAPAR